MNTNMEGKCYNMVQGSKGVSRICVLAVAAALSAMSVKAGVIVNGFEWEYAYFGNEIPVAGDAAWQNFTGSITPSPYHDGEKIVINTQADLDQQAYYTSTVWSPATSGISTVEFRLRLVSVTPGSALGESTPVFQIGNAAGGIVFCLGEQGLTLTPGSGTPIVTGFDAFQTHTFRLTIDADNNTFSLDIDGNREVDSQNLEAAAAGTVLRFGDMTSSMGGMVEYEYIAFNNTGAPVPEPHAALLLLPAIGAAVFFRTPRSR
jgi:hypothetical protein